MKHIKISISNGLLIVVILISNLLFIKNTFIIEKKREYLNTKVSELLIAKDNLIQTRNFECQSEGSALASNLILEDRTGKTHYLRNIIKKRTLVFRFSETHCSACIEQEIQLIKKKIPADNNVSMIFLCSYLNLRSVKVLCRTYNLKYPIYNLKNKLNLDMENGNIPYLFVINTNLICYKFQSVIKEIPILMDNYINNYYSHQ